MKVHQLFLLLVLGGLALSSPPSALALSVHIGNMAALPGAADIAVPVEVDDATGIAGGDLTLNYDPVVLRVQEVKGAVLLTANGITLIPNLKTTGQIRVSLAGATGITAGGGVLFTLSFEILSDALPGDYVLELTRAVFRDEQAQVMPVDNITGGKIEVGDSSGTQPPTPDAGIEVGFEAGAGSPGDTNIEVGIMATNASGLAGGDLVLNYDATALKATRVEAGDLALVGGITVLGNTATAGQVKLSLAGASGLSSGDGVLATVVFEVQSDAAPGTYELTFTRATFRDETAAVLPVAETRTGLFTVEGMTSILESPITFDFDLTNGDQEQRVAQGAAPGKTYSVQLNVAAAPEIKGWSATIEYDPAQVKYVSSSFQASAFIPGLVALVDEKEGQVDVGGTLLGSQATSSGDGTLGTLSFEVLDGFSGSTDLVITQVKFHQTDDRQTSTVRSVATITSEAPPLLGDLDGSGSVDFADFFLFADAFGSADPRYDFDGSGSVDFADFFLFADNFGKKMDEE